MQSTPGGPSIEPSIGRCATGPSACSPEDFVLFKLLSTRERDLADARSVIRSLASDLDRVLVAPPCEEVQDQAQTAAIYSCTDRCLGDCETLVPPRKLGCFGRWVGSASDVVTPQVEGGYITEECASCIMSQFGTKVPIIAQEPCVGY